MKITLDITKSVDENASMYFEKAKKARKKLVGVAATLEEFKKKQELKRDETVDVTSSIKKLEDVKKHWYEKFRWFVTSEGYLVIGGRDATTNEIVIKKHTEKDDLVFHTDMAGSPFVVIKKNEELPGVEKKVFSDKSIEEAACFTLIHSKAWKSGMSTASVFWVYPDQVSKEANSGEFMAKGSFMIRGKTNYVQTTMEIGAGIITLGDEQQFMVASIHSFSKPPLIIEQGNEKTGQLAKQIRSKIKETDELDVSLDLIVRALPQGAQLKKVRKRKSEL